MQERDEAQRRAEQTGSDHAGALEAQRALQEAQRKLQEETDRQTAELRAHIA